MRLVRFILAAAIATALAASPAIASAAPPSNDHIPFNGAPVSTDGKVPFN